MAIITERDYINNTLMQVAGLMMAAARTAPKGRGQSTLETLVLEGDEVKLLADKMREMGETFELPSFTRDAKNLDNTHVALALGCRIQSLGLKKCGLCGFANCEEKKKSSAVPCVFNAGDLGIAVGSAVSVAMDHRVDNRVMYSAGMALLELGWMGDDTKIAYLIPLSATSKNIYFDR